MAKIRVLKPFIFSAQPPPGEKIPVERYFAPGEHEVDDVIASHPWIKDHFADGRIETPEQAKERTAKAAAEAKRIAADAKQANELAEAAAQRLSRAAATTTKASAEEIERELNTPVNELKVRQGAGKA